MADLNKKYQTILSEVAQKIQNPNDLEFVKEKMNELIMEYMSSIDKILEIEKNQVKLESKVQKLERELSMIEEDIYVNDEFNEEDCLCDQMHDNDCEFEITCPYCGYEFLTDESYKSETEIKCPQCHEMIELDWKEEKCSGECQSCASQCYTASSEDTPQPSETIKVEENPADSTQNNSNTNQSVDYSNDNMNQMLKDKENNNEDDM